MALIPYKLSNPDASYSPLFRLLDEFNNHYSPQSSRRPAGHLPQWQPNFDIRETEEAFELYGEFPGMKKEDIHIKFTDPQTMFIHGKTERNYTSEVLTGPVVGLVEPSSEKRDTDEQEKSPQASVEDEETADIKDFGGASPQKTNNVDKAKYWVSERSIGEFSRNFTFPTQVDQDAVSANFKDGILNIVVPKAKEYQSRRITIN